MIDPRQPDRQHQTDPDGLDDPGATHVDCATCPARDVSCADCVVTVLLGPPLLDEAVTAAIGVLADRGLVPPLRDPREPPRRVG